MSHPARFRVWDKANNQWFKPTYKAYEGELEEVLLAPEGHVILRTLSQLSATDAVRDRFEIVWSAGLKDKAGTDIHEGDLVKGGFEGQTGEIRFGLYKPVMNADQWAGHQSFYVYWLDADTRALTRGDLGYWTTKKMETAIEVIGNIYEHPHLLKGGDQCKKSNNQNDN